jgi:hypothetical protein
MSSNILQYNLGELNLDIDLRNMNTEPTSGTNLPNPKGDEASSLIENLEPPSSWLPELNQKFLEFDEAFEEEYLLNNPDFGRIQKDKLSYFFEGEEMT